MIYVYKDRIINVEWTVLKGTSTVKENFDRALVKLFLIGPHEKFLLKANAKDGIVSAEVPQGLPEGVYSVEIIYIKNWLGVDRPPKMPDRFPIDCRGNDRCIMRSRKDNLFAITEYESEATEIGEGEVVIRVKTSTASYGYDGLSAYEIAVLRGDFEGTEGEWLEWTHERIVTDVKDLLDKLKSRDTRFVVKTKSQRDNLKDLREGDEVYVIDDGIAYILETENGKRTWKPCDYGTVTSKYILSLIAGMPGFVADRAIADEFGKRIVDEYLTRDAVRNYMNEVFNDLFVNNPPTIMDGMITVDMLSDAVKQLIGFGPIVNFPDDEFLTTKGGRITPKDRNYDPNNYSGMGRKILRKNMVNGVNVLTQKMMSCPNTVYVITYDYSLRGQTIMVPENCVLQFEGGTITNGVIKATNVINTYFKPEWFGAKGDNFTDDSAAFQMVSNLCNSCNCKTIRLSEATYLIDNITIYSYMSIIGEDKYKSVLKSYSNPLNLPILISDDTQGHNISLRNLTVESSGERTEYTVKILNKIGTIVDNCYFVRNEIIGEPNDYHGIFIGRKEGAEIVYITKFTNNRVNQCCVTIEGTDGYIDHNELWGIGCKSALHLIKSGNHMISANQIVGGSVNGAMYLTEWATSLKIFGNYFDGGSTTVANVPYGLNADTELIYSTITNNNFWLLDGAGIRAKSSIGNVINGNVFENNDRADNGTSDIILENTMSGSISNNSFVRAKVSRVNKSPILNITGYVGSDYEPIIINGNVVRGYRNYSASIYIPKDSTIKTVNNNSKLFEYSSNASPYRLFNPYGELNYNSGETIKSSPLDARVFTYIETDRKVRLDNLTYVDSTTLPESKKFDFNIIYNKDFNLYINNYNSVLNPPVWVTGNMWLENRYLSTGYCRQIIYSSNGNVLYSRISANSIWSEWVNADNTLTSKVKVPLDIFSFVYSDIVYKITNDIDLNGATLTLPSGCTLDFQGGSFSNGTIVGNGTKIEGNVKIECLLLGTYKGNIDGCWFIHDTADNTDELQNFFDLLSANNIGFFSRKVDVKISSSINVKSNTSVDFENCFIYQLSNSAVLANEARSTTYDNINISISNLHMYNTTTNVISMGAIIMRGVKNLKIENFYYTSNVTPPDPKTRNWALTISGIDIYMNNINIDNYITGIWSDGIHFEYVKDLILTNFNIKSGDDCIAINPQDTADKLGGYLPNVNSNIVISNGICASNRGNILRIGAGGDTISPDYYVENVTVNNITVTGEGTNPLISLQDFRTVVPNNLNNNILISNIRGTANTTNNTKTIAIEGTYLPVIDYVWDNIVFENLNITTEGIGTRIRIYNAVGIVFKDCTINLKGDTEINSYKIFSRSTKSLVFKGCTIISNQTTGCIIGLSNNYGVSIDHCNISNYNETNTSIAIMASDISETNQFSESANDRILKIQGCIIERVGSTLMMPTDSVVLFGIGQFKDNILINAPNAESTILNHFNDLYCGVKDIILLANTLSAITSVKGLRLGTYTYDLNLHRPKFAGVNTDNTITYYDAYGYTYSRVRGSTDQRPSLTYTDAGFQFYDNVLKKTILWNGTEWVNMDGTSLS